MRIGRYAPDFNINMPLVPYGTPKREKDYIVHSRPWRCWLILCYVQGEKRTYS